LNGLSAFDKLSHADAELAQFVYSVIFESLDRVCGAAEVAVVGGDLESAELARLQFKVESSAMVRRLEHMG